MSSPGTFYIPPKPYVAPTNDSNKKENTVKVSGGVMPFGFGKRTIEAQPWYVAVSTAGYVYVVYYLCHGPIDGVLQDRIMLDDKLLSSYANITVWSYPGDNTQVVNPELYSVTNHAWNYDLRGYAYMIIKYPASSEDINGIPNLRVTAKLLQMLDPRTNTTGWSPNPALHILHLLTATTVYGARINTNKINLDSFKRVADFFDTSVSSAYIVDETYNGVTKQYKCIKSHVSSAANRPEYSAKTVWGIYWEVTNESSSETWASGQNYSTTRGRYEFHYLFNQEQKLGDCLRFIFQHCVSNIQIVNGKYELICAELAAKEEGCDFSEPGNIVIGSNGKSTLKVSKMGSEDLVNVLNYTYISGDNEEHSGYIPDPEILGQYDERHELTYDFTGAPDKSQAKRLATYYYNAAQNPLPTEFETYFIPSNFLPGKLLTITAERLGWEAKQFVCESIDYDTSDDSFKYIIKCRRFDSDFFLYETIFENTIDQSDLPSPLDIPTDVLFLTASEDFKQLRDMTYITEITLSFKPSLWLWIEHYEVYYKLESDQNFKFLASVSKDAADDTGYIKYLVPLVIKDLVKYTFKVLTKSKWGVYSSGIATDIKPEGFRLPPKWKLIADGYAADASMTALVIGNQVRLSWDMPDESAPAYDINLKEYLLYRGKSSQTLNEATFLTAVSALSYTDVTCPSGVEVKYYLFAVDTTGSKSTTPLTTLATITPNQYTGFKFDIKIATDEVTAVSNANSITVPIAGDRVRSQTWIYPTLNKTWSQRFNTAKAWNAADQTYPMTTYPKWGQPAPVNPADMSITFDEMDLGTLAGGRWTVDMVTETIGAGTSTAKLILSVSPTGAVGSYTDYDLSTPQDFTCRYVIPKLVFTSNDDKTFKIVKGDIMLHLQAEAKKDFGQAVLSASSGSQPVTVTFATAFLAPPILSFAVRREGSVLESLTPLYENLTNESFDLYLLGTDNDYRAGTIDWKADGY